MNVGYGGENAGSTHFLFLIKDDRIKQPAREWGYSLLSLEKAPYFAGSIGGTLPFILLVA
jgi:hypothetical protein